MAALVVFAAVFVSTPVSTQKRTGVMAVRVAVGHSCSIDTTAPGPTGRVVSCESRYSPSVRTSTSTVPEASVGVTTAAGQPPPLEAAAPPSAQRPEANERLADSDPEAAPPTRWHQVLTLNF